MMRYPFKSQSSDGRSFRFHKERKEAIKQALRTKGVAFEHNPFAARELIHRDEFGEWVAIAEAATKQAA